VTSSARDVIQPGETPEQNGQPRSFYSRIDERNNEMVLLTYRPLDYESLPSYTLTVKAAVCNLRHVTWIWSLVTSKLYYCSL